MTVTDKYIYYLFITFIILSALASNTNLIHILLFCDPCIVRSNNKIWFVCKNVVVSWSNI